ncbi:MAG: transposase [Sciscionella sp.]|nr:transposase [Sciscionella sp.]
MISKKINGRNYYYLARSARVDGRPRIVEQRYLGTADDIAAALRGGPAKPTHVRRVSIGDVAAAWSIIDRLGLIRLVNAEVGRPSTAPSLGVYLAVAVLHRIAAPELAIDQWWAGSAARTFFRPRVPMKSLGHKEFWRALGKIDDKTMARVADGIQSSIRARFSPRKAAALVLDLPGVAGFTGADGSATTLAMGGVGVLAELDGAIPIRSHPYRLAGSSDHGSAGVVQALADSHPRPTTAILDLAQLQQFWPTHGLHFIGALPLGECPRSLARASMRTLPAKRFDGVGVAEGRAEVLGARRRLLLLHSRPAHAAQALAFRQSLALATRGLAGLATSLERGGFRPSRDVLNAEIDRIVRGARIERALHTELETVHGRPRLSWHLRENAVRKLHDDVFGRQLLVTDHDDWPAADVLAGYRTRFYVESTLRQFDIPFVRAPALNWRWTDDRIAVHCFIGVLATTVAHLMRREAAATGTDLSVRDLLTLLRGIEVSELRHSSTGGRPRTTRVLNELDPMRQRLFDVFELAKFVHH